MNVVFDVHQRMDKEQEDFHKRLQGMTKHDCLPSVNRNYLSDRFAKELRRAREFGASCSVLPTSLQAGKYKAGCPSLSGVQVLKSNLPPVPDMSGNTGLGNLNTLQDDITRPTSPALKIINRYEQSNTRCPAARSPKSPYRSMQNTIDNGAQSDVFEASRLHGLSELEEKVELLNGQAQQLLKQLRREQRDREQMSTLYDEALDEVRRLRERDRDRCGTAGGGNNSEFENKFRRLECERDEALIKVRTIQVDNEELRLKLERAGEEGSHDRQRILEKVSSLESRLHATETDRDELTRRHTRTLETMGKLEMQLDEQKTRLATLEDQKQDHIKQIDNLGLFIKDLEQSSKQMHDRLDEKRYELHQYRDRITELEDVLTKIEQHLQYEKDRLVQLQNDAYQAQIGSGELRNEVRNVLKKKAKSFD